ncbi:hypothetical protein HELRODRAFT_77906 [Helobdella robusta]|uniref:Rab-GAP TBC domain-containing protein n=1 Tax=Helobdella robusta TaxID=6412 RepID=T1G353_HELRO|nr:hypothetical protein HELRODRAFT_77906 [Helobdella robusta]ESO05170.1 hypothetical protein HELRODRAFT_77906 [Helobdella robusta]
MNANATVIDQSTQVSCINRARISWEKRVSKSLNNMSTELNVPLSKRRSDREQREVIARWTELGTNEPDLARFRPVYAAKDFLEVVSNLRNVNQNDFFNLPDVTDSEKINKNIGMIQCQLRTSDFSMLREMFKEMDIQIAQTGVDDQPIFPAESFYNERLKTAFNVLSSGLSQAAQNFSRRGCPVSLRSKLWCLSIGVDEANKRSNYGAVFYEQLKENVAQQNLLIDSLIYKDIKLTAANDDQYFVFEDYIYQILLPFSRDDSVAERLMHKNENGQINCYPPNAVVPFHGFAMYVAPLCCVYDDPVTLYYVFRELYTRHFYKLHTLSSSNDGIVSLCLQFETMLFERETQLFTHLKCIGLEPLKTAFKWIIRAFSGYLASEQVLLLWDRIIGYNSLYILSILSAAIFSFRRTNLMQVQSSSAAEAILVDLLTLEVVPLIQIFLFADK